ncbi:LOB domain-containing protein 16-like [Nicotiana tabacum]|uniref:LOB domain-containing protein 16-like n=1 Tax=Nicotiana tabacum TaxID=4097 RepID=A0A1S3XVU6_TOBAC|nr:LOB domain-containing protein 16-like [Nicotiana tomentosiformis]XP_016443832.1 PREDICTED: LOB domain-containing protein 16-like [Nicotiana tabacum]
MASGTGSPCGACKFLRRKCAADCIFAPYFCSEQGPARFAAIHKVFGASNVSKLLLHVPVADRCEAVVTIAYEAQARIKDPVYGCVAHIFALQQQVAYLQAQLMQMKAQMAQSLINNSRNSENSYPQWPNNMAASVGLMASSFPANNNNNNNPTFTMNSNSSPQSSLESIDHYSDGVNVQEIQSRDQVFYQAAYTTSRKRSSQTELGELQALALRMMKN